jgi:hypothetical protein
MKESTKLMVSSYARAFVAASLAVYATGEMDWRNLFFAGLSAIIGPIIRAINPKDPAFGMVADTVEIEVKKKVKKK